MEWIELWAKLQVYEYAVGVFILLAFVVVSVLVTAYGYLRLRWKELKGTCLNCNGTGKETVGFRNRINCTVCGGTGHSKYRRFK